MATSSATSPLTQNCELASNVIKAKLSKLIDKIPPEEISNELLSASIITEEEYESSYDRRETRKERTRQLIYKVMLKVKEDFEVFEYFCCALEKSKNESVQEWGKRLRADLEQQLKDSKAIEFSTENTTEDEALKRLKDEMMIIRTSLFQSDVNREAKYELAKEVITRYIRKSMATRSVSIEEQLKKLCFEEFVIPSNLHQWSFREMKRIHDEMSIDSTSVSESPPTSIDVVPPLFCKETVYHALLLTKVVQTCNAKNYESFLAHESHDFDEISLSIESPDRSNCIERYAIAKKGMVLYAAFLGERNISDWQDKYTTINEGVTLQTRKIPVRFFVEKIREGYQVIFTGFSFGALLATATHSFLWCQTCLSIDELSKNVACIAFAPPLVHVDIIATTLEKLAAIKENVFLFYSKNDIFPQIFCCIETKKPVEASLSSGKLHSGSIGSVILKHLAELQTNFFRNKLSQDSVKKHLQSLKSLLKDGLPKALTLKLFGVCHLMYPDSSKSRHVLSVLPDQAGSDQMNSLSDALIDEIRGDIFKQHSFVKYETVINQSYLHNPEHGEKVTYKKGKALQVLAEAKPSALGVVFSRLGDEVAVVVEGDNLWFCDQIKVGSRHIIDTPGSDASKRSINFNYDPINDHDLIVEHDVETVTVSLYSHFCNPIRKDVKATKKGDYHISMRQRQLARHTPLEVIILSFLSAMLEKPSAKYKSSGRRSRRFRSICRFLEDVVRIVPVETICSAVVNIDDRNAWKCAEAFVLSGFDPPPSLLFLKGLDAAHMRLTVGVHPLEVEMLAQEAVHDMISKGFTEPDNIETTLRYNKDEVLVTAEPKGMSSSPGKSHMRLFTDVVKSQVHYSRQHSHTVGIRRNLSDFHSHSDKSALVIHYLGKMKQQVLQKCKAIDTNSKLEVICNMNINEIYPAGNASANEKSQKLKPPIEVLVSAKQKLSSLQAKAEQDILDSLHDEDNVNEIKKLHNEEMIQLIDDIIKNDLEICVSLLGAFIQQQIQVPFINSPKETAHILQTTQAPSSVGVWALFSLDMLDFKRMMKSRQGIALIVEVRNYIQGILRKRDEKYKDDRRYAGKLQFLMQGMVSSVGCNTSYISYSLERQLHDLCNHFNITYETGVEELVQDWDKKFKGSVLFHVMQHYRPLLARWLIWSLSVHQLREQLASHTTVGIIGLSNSGKSTLVSSLFKQKVLAGTTSIQRTTIPFLYDLEGVVDDLSVIDFPGVDDHDRFVKKLTKLLLQLAQIIVLVIDYRRCSTDSAMAMLDYLDREGVPVLLCLSHADKLYANECLRRVGKDCPDETAIRIISKELEIIKKKIGTSTSRATEFFSFCQDGDSILNSDQGRETLKKVGIYSISKVGEWIEKELREHMQQNEIADALHAFLSETCTEESHENQDEQVDEDLDDDDPVKPSITKHPRGVTVSAEIIKEFVGSKATASFNWDGYGFKMEIPSDALPMGKTCHIIVKAITAGQFNFPKNSELVSSVYWIYSSCTFLKPVDVCIDHCAILQSLDDCNQMKFVLARCNQDVLPYNFSVKHGTFSPYNRQGLISLRSFSFIAAIRDYFFPNPASSSITESNRSFYILKVFGRSAVSQRKTWQFDFVFMKDVGPYKKDVDKKYSDGWIEEIPDLPFEFTGESLVIRIPERDAIPGWHIAKKSPNEITKRYIDQSTPDSSLQTCRLAFRWRGDGEPPPLDCEVELDGTVRNCPLTLSLPIEDISSSSSSLIPVSEQVSSQTSALTVEAPRVENNPNISVNVNVN